MFAKIGHARGHKWMEGKKSKKIEDNVQTDCQMYGYCNFVHWQGPHPEVMNLLDPFNLQQALGHVSKVHRSGSTCQKITNLIYTCNFYGAKLYSLDLRSLKFILVAIKIASSKLMHNSNIQIYICVWDYLPSTRKWCLWQCALLWIRPE